MKSFVYFSTLVLATTNLASASFGSSDLAGRAVSSNGTDRVTFIDVPPTFNSSSDQEIYDNVVKSRGGEDKLNSLDLTLLNSPNIEFGWMAFFGNLNNKTALDDKIRELVLCRIAVLNRAQYEFEQHSSLLSKNVGSGQGDSVLNWVKSTAPNALSGGNPGNIPSSIDDKAQAAFAYADAMTINVEVSNDIFNRLKSVGFSNQEIVELTANIGAYNGVSRFLVALHIGQKDPAFFPASSAPTAPATCKSNAVILRGNKMSILIVGVIGLVLFF